MSNGNYGSEAYRPLTAWQYFWLQVLYAIPFVGFIFLIIHSISGANINRRSFARSHFCIVILALIIGGIVVIISVATGSLAVITNLINGMSN